MAKGSKGMPGNMQGMLQQAQKMQAAIQQAQEETRLYEADGTSGGGMVKVKVNGDKRIMSLEISPEVIDPNDSEVLAEMIIAAINNALEEVQQKIDAKLNEVTGGMNIPGLF